MLSVKEQFDKDPANAAKAEQVRAMDLMARKAYFSSRWQVETGSYLLLAGALIFILCQRLIADNEKISPVLPGAKQDLLTNQEKSRKYLIAAASVIAVTAIASSFLLRGDLPDPSGQVRCFIIRRRKKQMQRRPNLIKQIILFSGVRIAVELQEDQDIQQNGMVQKEKILNGKPRSQTGQSSPVIWDDKIFITGAEDKECEVYCIDKKSGKILWTGICFKYSR